VPVHNARILLGNMNDLHTLLLCSSTDILHEGLTTTIFHSNFSLQYNRDVLLRLHWDALVKLGNDRQHKNPQTLVQNCVQCNI